MSEGPSVSVPRPPTVLQVVRLQAAAHTWEAAPGRIAHGATFEDQVPSPTIEARAGDTLTVISNRLTEPTGVRWRVLDSPDDATATAHGTSHQYTVHLSRRGLYLYRSAAGPLGGLFGAVIVRDLDEPVDNNTILIVDPARPHTPVPRRGRDRRKKKRPATSTATQSARTSDWSSSGLDQTPVTCHHRSRTRETDCASPHLQEHTR
jgi:hypothetical protein